MIIRRGQEYQIFQDYDDKYECQKILHRDHPCNPECISYGDLFVVHPSRLLQLQFPIPPLSLDQSLQLCEQKIKSVQTNKKQKKIRKQLKKQVFKEYLGQSLTIDSFKQTLIKLDHMDISLCEQSAILGLSINKIQYLHKSIKDHPGNFLFEPRNEHCLWLSEFIKEEEIINIVSIKRIFDKFKRAFLITDQNFSLQQFTKFVKGCGYSYKKTSSLKAQKPSVDLLKKRQIYAQQYKMILNRFLLMKQGQAINKYVQKSGVKSKPKSSTVSLLLEKEQAFQEQLLMTFLSINAQDHLLIQYFLVLFQEKQYHCAIKNMELGSFV